MKLPNAENAFIDIDKLTGYCLSMEHPRGRNKARMFMTLLGVTARNFDVLRDAIVEAVTTEDAVPGNQDEFGARYTVDFEMKGLSKWVVVRTAWIIRVHEDFPRLTSCYIL